MPYFDASQWRNIRNFLMIFALSLIVKLYASQLLVWEVDYVPVITRGQVWLNGGAFPAVGTLSSVAAYNMPFLEWMQLPVMLFTRDVALILILTQLIFNFIATVFVYKLGSAMFSPTVGLIASALFTFSETGISSAYTAWAQLLLPGFYVMVMYCLYRWKVDRGNRYIAGALILSTAAFMTHFSAVLLYGFIIAFVILLHLPLNWRGITFGILVSAIMLTPYLLVQVERNFVDLKAFFTRQTTIDREILDEYAYLKPENQARPTTPPSDTPTPPQTPPDNTQSAPSSRLERGIMWLLSIPLQIIGGTRLIFTGELQTLRQHYPILAIIREILELLLEVAFWVGIIYALAKYIGMVRMRMSTYPQNERLIRQRIQLLQNTLIGTAEGRNLILLLFLLGMIAGLVGVRAGSDQQATYYTGFISIQFVMCAYSIHTLMELRRYGARLLVLVAIFVGLGAMDRVVRVSTHDPTPYSPFNVALYQSIDQATAWIAGDWGDDPALTVSYDVMAETSYQWWVAPWNTVDPSYRIGMTYDHLLETYYGLINSNTNPTGTAKNPDYIIVYEPGLKRYDLENFRVERFGAIYVLTPERP